MTIVVVGHGRSPEGQRWGSKIDECSTVVRMWNWHPWQRLMDYGEKYDHGLFVLSPKGLKVFTEYDKILPSRSWLAYIGKPTNGTLPNGVPVELIDPTPWVEIGQGMGGAGRSGRLTLTRGSVAALWAIHKANRGDRVILVGFDNVMARTNKPIKEAFCPEYWKLHNEHFKDKPENYVPGPKTETHDMDIEAPLLRMLAYERQVELLFADFAWGTR